MSAAPAVVVGPGSVGCGVVAAALQADRQPYVLVSRTRGTATELRRGGVRVRYGGPEGRDITLSPTSAMAIDDPALGAAVAEASMLFVAVGCGQARTLVPFLATALAARRDPVPVLVCDNREGAAEALRALVAEHVVATTLPHRFAGVMVDRIVNRAAASVGRLLVAEAPGGLYVDRAALDGEVPDVAGLIGVDDLVAHLTRKRFVFSAGHAAAAYLGGLAGHHTLPEALEDEEVLFLVRAAMHEGQTAIAMLYGAGFAGGWSEVETVIRRFRSEALADPVTRVGRDPRRKLARGDRICGPALSARAAGTSPSALAVVAAAALTWGVSLDPLLRSWCAELGPRTVLARLASLDEHHSFVEQVLAGYAVLHAGGSPLLALEATGGHRPAHRAVRW